MIIPVAVVVWYFVAGGLAQLDKKADALTTIAHPFPSKAVCEEAKPNLLDELLKEVNEMFDDPNIKVTVGGQCVPVELGGPTKSSAPVVRTHIPGKNEA